MRGHVSDRCPHCGATTAVMSAEEKAAEIAQRYGWKLSELQARGRSQEVVTMRKLIVAVLRSAGISYPVIGSVLHRHHTTVLDGQQRVQMAIEAGFGDALPSVPWNAGTEALEGGEAR